MGKKKNALISKETSNQISSIEEEARKMKIRSQSDYAAAGEFIKSLGALSTEIDSTFDPIRTKQHAAWKETVAQKARHKAPVEAARDLVRSKMGKFLAKIEKKEEARKEKALSAGRMPTPKRPAPKMKISGVKSRKVWRFEIIDPQAIDAKYMIPDETEIRRVVNATGEDAVRIVGKGIRVYSEMLVTGSR